MSVTMSKADGVTVLTLTSDPGSACPPLCQIFKGLCYSPVCCSVSQNLRRLQGTSQSVLGALQIMVGILHLGLAQIISIKPSWFYPWFPVCPGASFVLFGTMCILTEKLPSPCVVIINVILNLAGVGFAITGIVIYSIFLDSPWWHNFSPCDNDYNRYWYGSRYRTRATPSPEEEIMMKKCEEGKELIMTLMRSIYIIVIVLSVVELCVAVSVVMLGMNALGKRGKGENKST